MAYQPDHRYALTCERCGRKLDSPVGSPGAGAVLLVLRTSTGTYHTPAESTAQGWAGTADDQGGFWFGQRCARLALAEGRQGA